MLVRTAVLILLLAGLSIASAADTRVTLESATPVEICPTCKTVTVPIKVGEKQIKLTEQPEVEAVLLAGDRRDSAKFAAKWIGTPKPLAIEISIDADALTRAGTYDIYLNLQPKSDPGGDRLKFQVTHPAPKLATITKLIIDRTYFFIGLKFDTRPKLYVTEISKKSNLTNLKIRSVGNASIGNKPIGGTLEFSNVPNRIDAGDTKNPEYQLANDFDVGTATGSLRLDVDETLDPIATADFEVRSHVHWIYIGLTIVVGLLCSYFIKVYLQQRLELDQAQVDAQELIDHIRDEETRHVDNTFRAAYRDQLGALVLALQGDSPQTINDAKTALDTAWRTAFQALSAGHQERQANYDKLRDVTNYNWLVPLSVLAPVTAASNAQAAVLPLLELDNLDQVRDQLAHITSDLGNEVRRAALEWQSNERQILDALLAKPDGISKTISLALEKPATDLSASLNRVSAASAVATTDQIQQVLNDVQFERLSVVQFGIWLKNAIGVEIANAEDLINKAHLLNWDSTAFSVLPMAEESFLAFLDVTVDAPKPIDLTHQLNTIQQAWTDALQGQFAVPNVNVQNALDAHDYLEATRTAIREKRGAVAPLGAVALAAPALVIPGFVPGTGVATHSSIYAFHSHFQTLFAPPPVARTHVTPAGQLRKDKLLQSFVIGTLLIVAGYGLQLNTFVGTFTDFSTLFFWAFGLDITVDALKNIAHK